MAHLSLFDAASGSAFLGDAGVVAKYPLVNIGLAVQNVGQRLRLGTEDETFPSSWRAGAYRSFGLGEHALNAALDYVKYTDEIPFVRLGGEFVYKKMLAFRLGYEFQNSLADANTLLYGVGVTMQSWSLDYALVPYLSLGTTHRLALTYKFDTASRNATKTPAVEPPASPVEQAVKIPVAEAVPATIAEPIEVPVATVAAPPVVEASAKTAEPAVEATPVSEAVAPTAPAIITTATVEPNAPLAVSVKGIKIYQVVITDAVDAHKTPGKAMRSFPNGTKKVYCWIRVSGKATDTFTVVWSHEGQKIASVPLPITFNPMRTWSFKSFPKSGEWKAEIVDSDGALLSASDFTVTK